MDARTLPIFFLLLTSVVIGAWQNSEDYSDRGLRRDIHYHSKRHMLIRDGERKRRISTQRPKELRKKKSGHLKPIKEEEIEDDEVVSVAVGPPVRQKFDKPKPKLSNRTKTYTDRTAVNLVKDVLSQLGQEFLTHQVNEDFVFGQYVGISMKNLTQDLKLRIQHDILDLILKYQKLNCGDVSPKEANSQLEEKEEKSNLPMLKEIKTVKNETDEGWPDFKNLAKIVG